MNDESVKKQLSGIRLSAMNILAGREHSIAELRQKLRRKWLNKSVHEAEQQEQLQELIETVLGQLLNDKLLDEGRFTKSFIRFRIAKGSGPVKIRHELMERGISSDLTDEYLEDSYDFWQEHIEAVRSKRFGLHQPEDYKEQSKQSRFLYQRGFSGELIRRLFNDF